MDMTAVMRKHSGRPFKPKGFDNLLREKPWSFFANSEAHPEGPGVGRDRTMVVCCLGFSTGWGPSGLYLKHCTSFGPFLTGASFLFVKMHKLQVIYFSFCSSSIQFASGMNSLSCVLGRGGGWIVGMWQMTEQLVGALNHITY